jgi:hypothetical protein
MVKKKLTPIQVKKELTVDEGDLWISNVHGAPLFQAPVINAELIGQYLENVHIKSGLDSMQRVIFQDDMVVSGINVETGEEDPDLTASLQDMCAAQDVELDYKTQLRWRDVMGWGPSIVNPVWGYEENEYRLLKLKRLPPESFESSGNYALVKNRILPGICWNEVTQEVEYWHKTNDGGVKQLTNVDMLTDPLTSEIGGTPFILPLIPIITALGFAWQKNLAQVNIFGTGGIGFIKVTNPKGDDKTFAQQILNNESSTNRYQLRDNMEWIPMGAGPTGTALETISELGMIVKRFFSPSDAISKDAGQILGGSSGPEYQLYMSFIKGQHRWLERSCRRLLQPYLVYNGYDPKKFRIEVNIPAPTPDENQLDIQRAQTGAQYGGITYNEFRARLGEKPLEGEQGNALMPVGGIAPITAMQKAEALSKFIHPVDPYGVVSKKGQRVFVQKTLGIEEDT